MEVNMKILKRNQLIILVISLMLITAGYLNFTSNYNNTIATMQVAELGDATLVSSNNVITDESIENVSIEDNALVENNDIIEENTIETAVVDNNQYFINSKLERDSMYSQILETYQEIYNDASITSEQKAEAMKEIVNVNNTKNAIMIVENLIMAKGFKNIVIFVNSNSISVVVDAEELKPEQVAQIQNIISRELNVETENIHISTK